MNPWRKSPFLRICIPLAIGICLSESELFIFWISIALLIGCGPLILLRLYFKSWVAKNSITGLIFFNIWLFAGILLHWTHNERNQSNYFANFHYEQILIKISDNPEIKNNKFRCKAKVTQIFDSSAWIHASGNLILRFKTSDSAYIPSFGDIIMLNRSDISEIPKNSVLDGFDYQKYLFRQNIHHKANPIPGQFQVCGQVYHKYGFIQMINLRKWLLKVFADYFEGSTEQGLIAAMVFGYRQNLDPEISRSFTNTGVVHILAVSGLHVGLVYSVLLFLTKFLLRYKKQNLRYCILLASLVFYTLLTGCSASVCRASLMLSVFIFADMLKRRSFSLNTLSSSAFILLVIDPNNLFQAGFQLSYLAVAGILIFNPWIEQLYRPKKIWIKKIWTLMAVSISAQLSTLPLCLFLFHQFPIYFLLANLFVIPLSTILLITASLIPFLVKIPIIPKLLATACSLNIALIEQILRFIESLPYHLMEHIPYSSFSMYCCYAVLIFFGLWIGAERPKFLIHALSLLIIWQLGLLTMKLNRPDQISWFCFYPNYRPLPACQAGNTLHVFRDPSIHSDSTLLALKDFEHTSEYRKLIIHDISLSEHGITTVAHQSRGLQMVRKLRTDHIEVLQPDYPIVMFNKSYSTDHFNKIQNEIICAFPLPLKAKSHHNLSLEGYWRSP